MTSEIHAREKIDQLLTQAGWFVQDVKDTNIFAGKGVAIREFPLKQGHGFADYLLYVDGRAAGVIEAKKTGTTLTGVETQSDKYAKGLPDGLPAWSRPLPFCYESTGDETRFTNNLDPEPRSRQVFAFHKPDYIFEEVEKTINQAAEVSPKYLSQSTTLRGRIRHMPELIEDGFWPAQIQAVHNLEKSLAKDCPRSLIQMATGSGKTFTAISIIYRLIKFAGAKRVLFLVDRGNLGKQTLKEFQQYVSPYNNYKFSEEFIVQRLTSNTIDTTARVCISTIQRLYSMLRGQELPEEAEDQSPQGMDSLFKEVLPLEYNPNIDISTFDFIITDECHRSIYNLWRQVLEYFDAHLIGLTATPSKQTFGFFNRNLVMEYDHERAVADGVNVNYDVYRIKTKITEQGSKVESGYYIDKRDRETRATRWEKLEEDFEYDPNTLDRNVVAVDQIRKIIQTFREKVLTEIFPGRQYVPKTLIFAKDDSHAEDIVKCIREEFGKGNDFAQKITYRTTGATPEQLIASFRNSFNPRIAVTVDMIATGTDIKPLEIVMFMRAVKSRSFFEQMKGRGVRIINSNDLQSVTPDARVKDHFVIVDCVGVCELDKTDSRPMERKPTVSFEKLLQAVSLGNTESDVISSLAARMARIGRQITRGDDQKVSELSGGKTLEQLTTDLVIALKPDNSIAKAKQDNGGAEPSEAQIKQAAVSLIVEATRPLHNPQLRNFLVEIKKKNEQVIDNISEDQLISAEFSAEALEKVKSMVQSFERFLADNRDEITALQVLYSKPYKSRLRFEDIKELAGLIEKPPHHFRVDTLWDCYAALEKARVKGANGPHILTDLVSLVRFAMHQENELVPFPDKVEVNFKAWLSQQEASSKKFSDDQRQWLVMIRDHIAANLGIETDDFDYAPFSQQGGLGKVHQLFGEELNIIIEQLNEALAA
ncbi:MAG: DEAD/DEAH box helicase family protein [Proteobacteria bacterium]|jgi:type I restriction enzyme R subunit|nr:DEAD/DEAH box helicase [Desulfocapsa sp.]MBU3946332.1 DEAD/DEAH box helicase family protein [Pseudomonadota bacterium]MCG2743897.1 DEAD/DEAH box helicase family protein [Desulfobacteraceae bacterium]MBU4029021.1 DEAD/DEAH box helicase family protein [Pseudomonadota bacterium]MBU4043076.1 DEAD/DEAH box helicase family protein [Pseudomonadota bacterium]